MDRQIDREKARKIEVINICNYAGKCSEIYLIYTMLNKITSMNIDRTIIRLTSVELSLHAVIQHVYTTVKLLRNQNDFLKYADTASNSF